LIHIDPWHFHKPSREALEDNINKKYANKVCHRVTVLFSSADVAQVIQHIGLCICLWDLLKASEGLISQAGAKGVNVNGEIRHVISKSSFL
jgi:DNA-directed RNA polymerase III subunit RPC8